MRSPQSTRLDPPQIWDVPCQCLGSTFKSQPTAAKLPAAANSNGPGSLRCTIWLREIVVLAGLTAVFTGLLVAFVMAFIMPVFAFLPMNVLAAIITASLFSNLEVSESTYLYRVCLPVSVP